MRLARKRSSSGEVVRSCLETAYQDCFERQAATVVLSVNNVSEMCPWTAKRARARLRSTPLAKSCRNPSSVRLPNPSLKTRPAFAGGYHADFCAAADECTGGDAIAGPGEAQPGVPFPV